MTAQAKRVLVVGTGRMSAVRVPHLVAADLDVTITGRDAERAGAVAAGLGVGFAPRDGLAARTFDAVLVTSASQDHLKDLREFLHCAPVLFCEKPVAATMGEARSLQVDVEASEAEVYVGFQRRFDPGVWALREQVRRGEVGDLLHVRASDFDHRPSSRQFIAKSGGMFRDLLIHDLDWMAWTTGLQIESVQAVGSVIACADYGDFGDCDVAAVTATLTGGAIGTLSSSRSHPLGQDTRMEVLGTKQSLSVGLSSRTPIRPVESGSDLGTQSPPRDFMERFETAFEIETHQFARYVSGEADEFAGCTLAEALGALAAAEACQASWEQGTSVAVTDVLRGNGTGV